MSDYFLKLPGDSQPRAYSEYEVREFLGQGVIDLKTLTWKAGMDTWKPIGEVLQEKTPEPRSLRNEEQDIAASAPAYRLRYSLHGLARLSILACLVLLPCTLWILWVVFSHNAMEFKEMEVAIQQSAAQMPPALAPLILLLSFLSLPSLVVQLVWLYRACANVHAFQIPGLRFTPLLSVILSCMPVVGMVLNAMIMQELYKASKKPEEWMLQSPSLPVRLYLISTTALTLCLLFPFEPQHYLAAFLVDGSLMAATSILWLVSVLQISKKQQELAAAPTDKRS